jgi:hypothetical protein
VSDFLCDNYERHLRVANRRHDLIAIRILDQRETEIPDIGLVELEDAETGERLLIDTSDDDFRRNFRENAIRFDNSIRQMFKSLKIDHINIKTGEPYDIPLIKFFKERSRRIR